MEKKEILLPSKRYFKADEQDLNYNVKLENDETLLREGDKDIVLNLAELFDSERNKSINYKIYGKIKMIFRNMYSGYTEYEPLLRNLYLVGDGTTSEIGFIPYNEFAFLRNDVLRERAISTTGSTLGGINVIPTIELIGDTGHTTTTSIEAPYKNWNLYLSYVYSGDTTHPISYTLSGNTNNVFNFKAGDGIPFRVEDNGNYYTLTSPIEHGVSQGEHIILSGSTMLSGLSINNKIFYVDSVGNQIYNSENYVINLLKSEFTSGHTLSGVTFVLGKRCTDIHNISGTTSTYYVHKHKTLTSKDDYIMDKVGFESSLFEDERKILFENPLGENDVLVERNRQESVLFDFKKTFALSGITNNLGYTPTEVYVSIVLKNENGFFNYPPKVGYKFNFHNTWVDQHFSGTTSIEKAMTGLTQTFSGKTITTLGNTYNYTGVTFTGGTTIPVGTSGLTGAFVEYNKKEMKERIISEAYHRFSHRPYISGTTQLFNHLQFNGTTFSGTSLNNMIGYYYQPYHRVKLRQLSPYIETSKLDSTQPNTLIDLPENSIFDENEKLWKWRDLYDHGFVDQEGNGTNFPFMNNIHYVVNDINFYLRNEQTYFNKADGINGYNNYKNKTNC
jgi:hypothetical protein